jgi:hypothetical protein
MATGFLSPIGTPTQQFFSDQGIVLSGGLLYTYLAGTTTPAPTYTTPNLAVANPNPIVLNSNGRAPQEIWLQQGTLYKFVLTDANNNPLSVGTFDNIAGINDVSASTPLSEWLVSTLTPTFINGTQFSVPGNQTSTFSVGRRIYASVSAGTIYGTITASSFGSGITTVTVQWDSGTLDNGLTQVAVGLLNPTNPSYLSLANIQSFGQGVFTLACTPGANRARVRMIAGGGAGGGNPNTFTGAGTPYASAGGGGGGGGYIEFYVKYGWQTFNGSTLTVGGGGANQAGGQGFSGGSTTFGSLGSCTGGIGGGAGPAISQAISIAPSMGGSGGVPGGVSFPGAANVAIVLATSGNPGDYGLVTGNASGINGWAVGGKGGDSPIGGGGVAVNSGNANPTATVGVAASGAGSGGSGSASFNWNATVAGGVGGNGIIIVEEYF